MGTDNLAAKLKITSMIGEGQSLSKIIAGITYFFLVFFGIVSGIEMLGFERLTHSLHTILHLSGNILFGLIIMVVGNFICFLVYKSLAKTNKR